MNKSMSPLRRLACLPVIVGLALTVALVLATRNQPARAAWQETESPAAAGDLDLAFAPTASTTGDGQVAALAVQSDGKILIGGFVNAVNGIARNGIARLNTDGSLDTSFANGLAGTNGEVTGLAVQADGKIVIGGDFNTVNGVTRNRIARLNTDGTLDSGFANGQSGLDSFPVAILVQSDGKVIIGGLFTQVNGATRNSIARLNSDGTLDTTFGNGLAGADGSVLAVAVQSDGKVVIGGTFTTVNGVTRNRIARLNTDGTLDSAFLNGQSGANNNVTAVEVQADGKVLIGGLFTDVNGISRGKIARLNTNGTLDAAFANGLAGADGLLLAARLQADGKIVIGGTFTTVNGVARNNLARLNADGTLDTSYANGQAGTNTFIGELVLQIDGKAIIGGIFNTVNGLARNHIARLNTDGTLDTGFTAQATAFSDVFAVAAQSDGKVVIGGSFTTVNGAPRNGIARLNTDGTLDSGFGNGQSGADSFVFAVAAQNDGKVVIGGTFNTVNGVTRNRIARLNSDGTLDTAFLNGQSGANLDLYAVAVQSDGKVVLGGSFTNVNGVSRNGIARLNSDGTLDAGFLNGQSGTNNQVLAIAVQADGKVIIGGDFTQVNGGTRNKIARLNSDGTLDSGFAAATTITGDVLAVAAQSDGKVVIGGSFTSVNGTTRNSIARLNADGTLDASFANGQSGANLRVNALALQSSDGKAVIVGDFTIVNGVTRNYVARLNTDGTLDTTFLNGQVGADGQVFAVALQSDGKTVIGGSFAIVNNVARTSLARLLGDVTPPTIAVSDVTQAEGSTLGNSASYTGPPVTIPDNNATGVNIPLIVTGVGAVSDLNFRFDTAGACDAAVGNTTAGVTHTWVGDLVFRLTSPAGTTVTFIDRIGLPATANGFDGNNFCAVSINDDGGLPFIENFATQPVAGNFAPNNPFAAFDGQNASGVWTLNVSDNALVDTGTLNRFSLVFNSGNFAEGGPKRAKGLPQTNPSAPSSVFAFNVTLSEPSSQTVMVNYATANGTATAGSDYTAASGTVTFNPGEISKPVAVTVIEDTTPEPNETFNLNLSTPVNATISDGLGVGTIANDDFALSISGRVMNAANQGAPNINVTLSGPVSLTVTTNQSGNYAFTGLSANAAYAVTVSSPFFTFTPPRADFPNLSANQTQNFTALTTPPAPATPLTDDFSGPARDATKWTQGILTQPPGSYDPNVIVTQGGAGAAQTFSYTGAAVVIPDNNTAGVNVTLPVSGFTGNIADLNFRFDGTASSPDPASSTVGLNHSFLGDLQFKLTSPAGTTVTFFNRVNSNANCASNNIFNLTLDDEAATNVVCPGGDADGPLTGLARPDAALTAFDGQNPNGNWTLNIADLANLDTGSLRRFSLVISSATGGQLRIQPVANQAGLHFGGYVAVNSLDLSNGQVAVELVQAGTGGAQSLFSVGTDFNNFARFLVMSPIGNAPLRVEPVINGVKQAPFEGTMPMLMFQLVQNGVVFLNVAIPYDPVAHRFLRFRHFAPANQIIFETSPDTTLWTERARGDLGERTVQAITVELAGGTAGSATNPGPVIFDNLVTQVVNARFALAAVTVSEGAGAVTLNVSRTGLTTLATAVEYFTLDGTATQRTRYVAAAGVLSFAAGETSKSLSVLLLDNALVDGAQTFDVFLGPGLGMGVNGPGRVIVTVTDNDTPPANANPLETPAFFVTQQYYDFLARQPDQAGLDFWVGQIVNPCAGNPACISQRRWNVSNAFFFELEFQQTGSYVYRLYRAAYGNTQPFPNAFGDVPTNPYCVQTGCNLRASHVPSYAKFVNDRARLDAAQLAATQLALATTFVNRAEFRQRYPLTQSAEQFVDAALATLQVTGVNLTSQRSALIALYNGAAGSQNAKRGAVMYRLADDNAGGNPINNRAFIDAEYSRSFVLTQYFGYLRRDPDMPGLNFWLDIVTRFPLRSATGQNAMVCAFITSGEYQTRFSLLTPRTDAECPTPP